MISPLLALNRHPYPSALPYVLENERKQCGMLWEWSNSGYRLSCRKKKWTFGLLMRQNRRVLKSIPISLKHMLYFPVDTVLTKLQHGVYISLQLARYQVYHIVPNFRRTSTTHNSFRLILYVVPNFYLAVSHTCPVLLPSEHLQAAQALSSANRHPHILPCVLFLLLLVLLRMLSSCCLRFPLRPT